MSSGGLTTRNTETTELATEINQLTEFIIGCATKVQPTLGPGLLESAYGIGLSRKLSVNDVAFERQKGAPVAYKAVKLDCGYRADLILDRRVLVEIELGDQLAAIHDAKLLSYLKLSGLNWASNQFQCAGACSGDSWESSRTARTNFLSLRAFRELLGETNLDQDAI